MRFRVLILILLCIPIVLSAKKVQLKAEIVLADLPVRAGFVYGSLHNEKFKETLINYDLNGDLLFKNFALKRLYEMTIRSTTERHNYISGPDFPFKPVNMDIVVTEKKGQMYVNDKPCEVTHKPGDEYQTVDMGKIYVELVTPLYQDPMNSLIDLHVDVEPVSVEIYLNGIFDKELTRHKHKALPPGKISLSFLSKAGNSSWELVQSDTIQVSYHELLYNETTIRDIAELPFIGSNMTVKIKLPLPSGKVYLSSNVPEAIVRLYTPEGEMLHQSSPGDTMTVTPGQYRIAFEALGQGYYEKSFLIDIAQSQSLEMKGDFTANDKLDISLQKIANAVNSLYDGKTEPVNDFLVWEYMPIEFHQLLKQNNPWQVNSTDLDQNRFRRDKDKFISYTSNTYDDIVLNDWNEYKYRLYPDTQDSIRINLDVLMNVEYNCKALNTGSSDFLTKVAKSWGNKPNNLIPTLNYILEDVYQEFYSKIRKEQRKSFYMLNFPIGLFFTPKTENELGVIGVYGNFLYLPQASAQSRFAAVLPLTSSYITSDEKATDQIIYGYNWSALLSQNMIIAHYASFWYGKKWQSPNGRHSFSITGEAGLMFKYPLSDKYKFLLSLKTEPDGDKKTKTGNGWSWVPVKAQIQYNFKLGKFMKIGVISGAYYSLDHRKGKWYSKADIKDWRNNAGPEPTGYKNPKEIGWSNFTPFIGINLQNF